MLGTMYKSSLLHVSLSPICTSDLGAYILLTSLGLRFLMACKYVLPTSQESCCQSISATTSCSTCAYPRAEVLEPSHGCSPAAAFKHTGRQRSMEQRLGHLPWQLYHLISRMGLPRVGVCLRETLRRALQTWYRWTLRPFCNGIQAPQSFRCFGKFSPQCLLHGEGQKRECGNQNPGTFKYLKLV